MQYIGQFRNTLDEKNRMRIPTKVQNQFGGKEVPVTISAGADHTLMLMTADGFKNITDKISENLLLSDFEKQRSLRVLFSTTFTLETDPQGRFVLPSILKEYAGIDKEMVILGTIDKFEIIPAERFDEQYSMDNIDINNALTTLGI